MRHRIKIIILALGALGAALAGGITSSLADEARVEVSAIKVACAAMVHDVVDRAMQVYGGEGMTDLTPLESMYRHARYGRIVDGPDEVHVQRVARDLARRYQADADGWDFAGR